MRCVSEHDFSRAEKCFLLVIPSGLGASAVAEARSAEAREESRFLIFSAATLAAEGNRTEALRDFLNQL